MLKIIFLCVLLIYLVVESQQVVQNNKHSFNLVSVGSTFSGSSFAPFYEITTKFQQQCVSLCTYNGNCLAFDVTEVGNGIIECKFYTFYYDRFMRENGVLASKNHVKLYSVKIFPKTCADWYKAGHKQNGVYEVQIGQHPPRLVYCYMEGEGGGWMAFQRRFNGSVDFYRKWNDYKKGFGDGSGEYWLGNDLLHEITHSGGTYDLFVVAKKFGEEEEVTKKFEGFSIGSEEEKYVISYDAVSLGYNSAILFEYLRNQNFSTWDQDNDNWGNNCALTYLSGWWFNVCHNDNFNGPYSHNGSCPFGQGLNWNNLFSSVYSSLEKTNILIKERA